MEPVTERKGSVTEDIAEDKPLNQNGFIEQQDEKRNCRGTCLYIVKNITVEPTMILFIIGAILTIQTSQNLSLDKACRVNLNFTTEICDSLRQQTLDNQNIYELETQKLVATYLPYKTYIQATIPSLLALFAGSFSDKVGRRKIFLIIAVIGQILTCVSNFINTYFFYELRLEVLVFSEAVIDSIFGSWCLPIFTIFAYIAAVTREDERTFRMGLIHFSMTVGLPIGMGLSGVLLKKTGYYGCYGISMCIFVVNFVYNTFILKDPVRSPEQQQHDNRGVGYFLRAFFDLSNIRESLRVVFKKGPDHRRVRMCVMMMVVSMMFGSLFGEISILYLNTRYRFNWDEVSFSIFQTYNFVTHTFGTIFSILVFSKYLQWHDSILGIISTVSKIAASFFYGFASTATVFYIGPMVEILNGTALLAMRSMVSKLVAPNELGKVNSVFGLSENLMPLVFVPLYSNVYKATMEVFPGAVFLMGAFLLLPALSAFIWLFVEHRQNVRQQRRNAAMLKKEIADCEPRSEVDPDTTKEKLMSLS